MKTTAQKLAMVFIFFVQMIFAQDAHQKFESTFFDFDINSIVETLKIKKRYAEDSAIQAAVDSSFNAFQLHIKELLLNDINLSNDAIAIQKNNFLTQLNFLVISKPESNDSNEEIPTKMHNGPCVNMDIETGDLTGWDLFVGQTDGSVPYSYINSVPALPGPNHLVFGGGLDPVTGLSCVNPDGGSFSVRLGNGTITGKGAARMSQEFLVDASNIFFTYSYAVVFQSPDGHTANERPYFTVRVYDEFGANIPCGEYSVIADASNIADYQSLVDGGGETVLYKDWSTVFTNLSAYIGQNVTIEFTTGDCSRGGHYAYAYIDASCSFQQITATDYDICPGENSTLTAPDGVGDYLWSTGETTQSITINAGGTYTCLLTPPQGPGCSILLDVTINAFPVPVANFTIGNASSCLGTPVNFTDNSTIPAPGTISSYQWDFGNGISTPSSSGVIVAVPNTLGTYTSLSHNYLVAGGFAVQLSVVSADGCTNSISIPLVINSLPAVVGGLDQTVCAGTAVTLSGIGATTYTWNNGVINNVAFVPAVGLTVYSVSGTDGNGCVNADLVQVLVNPLPIVNAGPDQVVCLGDAITLNGSGATTYSWDNGVTNGVAFNPLIGNSIYTVTGTNAANCENTDQVTVHVNPLPIVGAGIDQVICSGETITLSGSGAINYTWDNGVLDGVAFVPSVGIHVYTLTGTNVNNCENTDQVQVTVNALPIVNAGPDQTECFGTAITLSAAGAVSYSWDNGVTNGVAFIPTVGIHVYTVTGTSALNCENTDQVQVTIHALPVVNGGFDQIICEGDAITLNGTGAVLYSWDNGITNGLPFNPAVGTLVYTVTGTDANNCENTDQVSVTVNALPVVNAGLDQVICFGDQVTLNAIGASTYSWNNGIVNGVAFTPTVGLHVYTVTGTNVNSCENADQVQVLVNALPNVNAGPDQLFCFGGTATLSGSGAANYTWNNGVVDGIGFIPTVGIHVYSVTGTDNNGCESGDAVQVTVNPNPVVNAGLDQSTCEGEFVTLTASGATFYIWDNSVVNGIAFQPALGTTNFTVIGSFATGCQASDIVSITVHANPIVTTHNAEICRGESVTLNGFGAVSYSWTGGIQDNVAFFPNHSENYIVTGTDVNNCSSTALAKVIVHELPTASFNMSNNDFTIINPSSMFFNTSNGAVAYIWDFNDGSPISHEVDPFHEFPSLDQGTYSVQLTAISNFGCMDSTIRVITVKDELLFYVPNAFTPDGDAYNNSFNPVFVDGFDPQDYTLYIFNRWGQIVFETHDTNFGWNGYYGLDGTKAEDGVYTWKIMVGSEHNGKKDQFVGHVSLLR